MLYASFSVRCNPQDLPAGENELAFLFVTSFFLPSLSSPLNKCMAVPHLLPAMHPGNKLQRCY